MGLESLNNSRMVKGSLRVAVTYDTTGALGRALEDMDEDTRRDFLMDMARQNIEPCLNLMNEGRLEYIIGVPLMTGGTE